MENIQNRMVLIALTVLVGGLVLVFYFSDLGAEKNVNEAIETKNVHILKNVIKDRFHTVLSDLKFLADNLELIWRLEGENEHTNEEISGQFLAFSKRKSLYDPIRYIDSNGMEIVRVNFNDGQPVIVSPENLQNKSGRYYFSDSFKLDRGEIYVSPFDLNVEHGVVEMPPKLMIRLGTPVYDDEGVKKGIMTLNYLGSKMLDTIRMISDNSLSRTMLVNAEGHWILGLKPEDEWGFMLEDRKEKTFGATFVAEWKTIYNQEAGQFTTANGLFTFETIYPYKELLGKGMASAERISSGDEKMKWKIVSLITQDTIADGSHSMFGKLLLLYVALLLILLFVLRKIDSSTKGRYHLDAKELSPKYLFLTTAKSIFIAELIVMLILPLFPPLSPFAASMMDATLLTILAIPMLYFFLFRPLLHHMEQRRLAEGKNISIIRDLDKVNEELKDFAYIVSHDLKAPLRAISSLALWIYEDYKDQLDDEGRENLQLLLGRTKRMNNLIIGILNYSRIGKDKTRNKSIDTNQLVSDVIKAMEAPSGIKVKIEGELPVIIYDSVRLEQVFQNLIGNAIIHMGKPEGEVVISSKDGGDFWIFSIMDTGKGIEEKHFERIFKIFQSLTARDVEESTGIGLSIIRKIVEGSGGIVDVRSTVGEGSVFSFTIPKNIKAGAGRT